MKDIYREYIGYIVLSGLLRKWVWICLMMFVRLRWGSFMIGGRSGVIFGQLNGWLNRSYDRAPSLSLWTAPRFNSSDSQKFDNWRDKGLSLDFFYIDPSLYDSVFVNQYQGDQSQDQFICEVTNNVQAILPMSVTGEPLI